MLHYQQTAELLTKRIYDLIPKHPRILEMESAWDLFKIQDFQCGDLSPSAAQASLALANAKYLWSKENG